MTKEDATQLAPIPSPNEPQMLQFKKKSSCGTLAAVLHPREEWETLSQSVNRMASFGETMVIGESQWNIGILVPRTRENSEQFMERVLRNVGHLMGWIALCANGQRRTVNLLSRFRNS